MASYALLFLFSLWLNRRDKKMLLVTVVVAGGVFFPIPGNEWFYLYCIIAEIVVFIGVTEIKARVTESIQFLSMLLILWHIYGWCFNGFPPDSPYHGLVKGTESAELLALILFSDKTIKSKKGSHV